MNQKLLARAVLGIALFEHLAIFYLVFYLFLTPVPEHHDCMTAELGHFFGLILAVLGSVNAIAASEAYHAMLGAGWCQDLALLTAGAAMALAPLLVPFTFWVVGGLGWLGLLTPFSPYIIIATLMVFRSLQSGYEQ
jgi:hypothetical protein